MGIDQIRDIHNNGGKPKEKKRYYIPRVSKKRQEENKIEKDLRGGEDTDLQKWFKAIQKKLTGKCMRCGATYNKYYLPSAIAATAHILAKRDNMFPSVKTHPLNFIELPGECGCHHWFDKLATWEEIKADKKIWPIIRERFLMMEPEIKERNKIPDVLLSEIKPPFI